jgi:hypothetical protein
MVSSLLPRLRAAGIGPRPGGRVLPPTNSILVSNPAQLVGDYTNPILKPQAAEAVKSTSTHGDGRVLVDEPLASG